MNMKNLFNFIYKLTLDETSKLPSSRKWISFIFTGLAICLVALCGFIVFKMTQGRFSISNDKLRALNLLKGLLYICCAMILLLLAVVTMQQLINFRTNSLYNSPPGVAPVDPQPVIPAAQDPEEPKTDPS
jgi:formate hydrogenlyase subunit 3/multisubunit Na+/H+ antiporter MnhD subunit